MSLALSRVERQVRAWSGVVVAVFVTTHLVNHAFAIYSLDLAEQVRAILTSFWHSMPATIFLYGAFIVHFVTALLALFRRSTLRMSVWEAAQLLLGLLVLPLMITHVLATRGLHEIFGVEHTYARVSLAIWGNYLTAGKQALLVLVVWLHAVIGLHFWLRVMPWYPRYRGLFHAVALLVPVLSLIGFTRGGQQIINLRLDEQWVAATMSGLNHSTRDLFSFVGQSTDQVLTGYLIVLIAVLVVRQLRLWLSARRGTYQLELPDGRSVRSVRGRTMLEALRTARVPHASVCGGRGRCTTCRVRVGVGVEQLPAPGALEAAALSRIGAPDNVRLACQTRPSAATSITPLIAPDVGAASARRPGGVSGREQVVTTLFLDLRGSTGLGERKLPYDVLFILNQFFAEMAGALAVSHGHYAQFAGDGLMALYGLERNQQQGARDAIDGARLMLAGLDNLNRRLNEELDAPLRIGIGIHTGEAIVGTMGPPTAPNYSAIGDNINIAARLESRTKDLGCTAIISAATISVAGFDARTFPHVEVDVRGREGDILVCTFKDGAELPETQLQVA